MNPRTLAMAAVATGLSATAAQAAPAACAVEIEFASMCCGVDRTAHADIKAFLADNPLAKETSDRAWGMEGEQTVCVQTASPADAEALFAQIKARLPAGAKAGAIKVTVGGKTRLTIPTARRSKVGPKG
jgi:hypothetical protein